ncbi:MAG: hypothetical protein DWQ01_19770 [Planctomycetota bacterium]|nr:MAG: hypothetical protein DWQ01_19770 [Planctomycetota bacterium]
MNPLFDLLVRQGIAVAFAVTAMLGLGALIAMLSRNPLHRERAAEFGIIGAALAFLLVLLPLPGPVGQWSAWFTVQPPVSKPVPIVELDMPDHGADLAETWPAAALASLSTEVDRWASPGVSISEPRRPSRILAIAFLTMALVVALYLLACAIFLARLRNRAARLPAWLESALPKRNNTQILQCGSSLRPMCFGTRQAYVILPKGLIQTQNTPVLRSVVEHEFAHLELGHLRWRQLMAACSVLLFAHPLYWWLARVQRSAAELLADDRAASRVGKARYVEQLISMAEQLRFAGGWTRSSKYLPLSALAAPEDHDGLFYQRMRTLLMRPDFLRTRLSLFQIVTHGFLSAAALACVTFAVGRPASAQELPQDQPAHEQTVIHTVVRGSEGVGRLLCQLGDLGLEIQNLNIGKPNANGERKVRMVLSSRSEQNTQQKLAISKGRSPSALFQDKLPKLDGLFGQKQPPQGDGFFLDLPEQTDLPPEKIVSTSLSARFPTLDERFGNAPARVDDGFFKSSVTSRNHSVEARMKRIQELQDMVEKLRLEVQRLKAQIEEK